MRHLRVLFSLFSSKLPIFNGPVADAERANEVITAILPGGHSQYALATIKVVWIDGLLRSYKII